MRDRELKRRLLRLHAPDELAAERRAWALARAAFDEREPVRRHRNLLRPVLVLAALLAIVGAIASPPVWSAFRKAVGTTTTVVTVHRRALFSLPATGPLLVNSERGAWVVQPGGERRLLGSYRDASWSPHGRFVAAVGRHEVVALDPKGNVRWSLARSGRLAFPRWSPDLAGSTRVAYLRDATLRVVDGDDTHDRLLAGSAALVPPAWRPGSFTLAYSDPSGRVHVVDSATGKTLWQARAGTPRELAWSDDGSRLLVLSPHALLVFRGTDGRRVSAVGLAGDGVSAAFQPGSHRVAVVLRFAQRSIVLLRNGNLRSRGQRVLFGADGSFTQAAWSATGRWLVVTWPSADAFVFVGRGRPRVVGDIGRQFQSGPGTTASFPSVPAAGWCCSFAG